MKDGEDQSWWLRWGWPTSVGVHLIAGALLLFGLPISLPQPSKDQPIAVELVPPPEQAKAEPPPPAPETKPETPQKEEAKAEPPAPNEAVRAQAAPVLKPVFQFGENDAGPRESLDGNSSEESKATSRNVPDKPEPTQKATDTPVAREDQMPERDAPETRVAQPADVTDPASQQNGVPALTAMRDAERQAALLPSAAATVEEAETPVEPAPIPSPKPAVTAEAAAEPVPQEVKRLFSQSASGAATATTAMDNLPREVRGGRLCVTEMREQLLRASPPYFPDLLPSYPLKDGNVLDVPKAAFRMRGQWFNLNFRCVVNADATRVESFAFRVGEPLPRSEWASRGLPAQ